jgi:Bacterial Ig-like domain/Peptidase M10 serralysin C terminal/FG-GAP-like repeat/RTX calcium-binding nonapeptide repeat (4 copies)/Putative Ig domain/Bacterial Ig domain
MTFTSKTGTANPFNGIDIGIYNKPTLADIDGDGDLDLLVGEFFGTVNYYKNTGSEIAPSYTAQTGTANPFNGIDIGYLSTPTLADIDGDGDLDLLVGEQDGTVKYYKNTGTAIAPSYTEQTGTANPFNGIDIGDLSTPTFADIDGDGDLDLLVGEYYGTLKYYKNTGSAIAPSYAVQTGTANPFDSIDIGDYSAPTLADIDGDGDLDLLVGASDGTLKYYKNTGSGIAPSYTVQTGTANPFNGIDIGSYSTPTFADIDGDGDLDLLVGEYDGTLKYYKNTGSGIAPSYTVQTGTANPFNGIDIGSTSAPTFADIDGDGDLDLLVGAGDGTLKYYKNAGSAIAPSYTVQTGTANPFDGIDIGSYSKPTLADIDGDGDLDLLVGANDGTLNYYKNTGSALTVTISSDKTSFKAGETATVTFTFSEVPTGFDNSDITISGGELGTVTVDPNDNKKYTATFTPTATNTLTGAISIAAAKFVNAAGNDNIASNSVTVSGDTLKPNSPTISTVATDDKVNATEKTAGVTISGTAEANSTVSITWGTTTLSTTADNTGAWTKAFTTSQIPTDAATTTISVTATDAAGNTSTAAIKDITVDTLKPNAPTISTVATDDKVNAAEKTAGVTISGTAEANSTVNIAWGATTLSTTADNTGAWTQAFTASQVPADAATTTISVTATDVAGNTSTAATKNITVDTVITVPTISTVATDDKVNAAEKTAGVTIAGTAEANSTVKIAWGATTLSTTADNTGAWTQAFTASQVPADAATTTISVTATDAAGNTSTAATKNITVDTTAPTATIVLAKPNLKYDNTLQIVDTSLVTISFSEAVTGFTNDDLSIANGTLSAVTSADNGKTWTGTFTPTANFASTTNSIQLTNTGVFDLAGNAGVGTTTSNNYQIDTRPNHAPTVVKPLTAQSSLQDRAFSLNITNMFQDVDPGDVLTYTATLANNDTLPTWLTFANGSFSGSPTASSSNLSITVTATDKLLASVSSTFDLNVLHPITSPTKSAIITATANDDYILGTVGNDKLYGGAGNDFLYGGAGNDFLYGEDGDDLLNGGSGNDNLNGGIGNDTYQFDITALTPGATHVVNEAVTGGTDTLDFSGMSTAINVDLNLKDQYVTTGLRLVIPILSLENVVGGSGNDTISGNKSDNILTGGAGSDEFRFSVGALLRNLTAPLAMGRDTIADFTRGEDKISLSKATFNLVTAGTTLSNSDFAVVANDAAAVGASTRIVYSQSSHGLFLNDGIHSGQFATLANNIDTLGVSDFKLIA